MRIVHRKKRGKIGAWQNVTKFERQKLLINIHSLMVYMLPRTPLYSKVYSRSFTLRKFFQFHRPKVCRSFLNLMIHRIFCVSLVSSFFKSPLLSRENTTCVAPVQLRRCKRGLRSSPSVVFFKLGG